MREIVPRQFQRVVLVAGCDQCEFRIAIKRAIDIAYFAIHACGNRRLGKAGSDSGGDVARSASRLHFAA